LSLNQNEEQKLENSAAVFQQREATKCKWLYAMQQASSSREQNPENEENLEEDESIMISFSEGAAVEPVFTCEFCKDQQDEF